MKTINKKNSLTIGSSLNRRGLSNEARKLFIEASPADHSQMLVRKDYEDLIQLKAIRKRKDEATQRLNFSIGLALALLLVVLVFEWKFYDTNRVDALTMAASMEIEELVEIPTTNQPPPPVPKLPQQVVIVEVNDEVAIEEIEIDLDVEISEESVIAEIVYEEMEVVKDEEIVEEVFQIVESNPTPDGGMAAFYEYVSDHLEYPKLATRQGIQGRVFVQFVVGKDGAIRDVVVIKGIGGGCDEEAQQIIASAPRWNPGKQRGKAVSVRMVIPITFKLADKEQN